METVFFLVVISLCPVWRDMCNSPEHWVRLISEPFEVEQSLLHQPNYLNELCIEKARELGPMPKDMGHPSRLCVREDIWRKHHKE